MIRPLQLRRRSTRDAIVAFACGGFVAVMVGVSLVPITVGGWGLRELATTTLLQAHGVAPERALFFSVSFGLVVFAASSLGATVWAFYSPERAVSAT